MRDNDMKQILMLEVSPRGKDSASRSVADTLAARLTDLYPSAKLIRRDLAAEHLSHLERDAFRFAHSLSFENSWRIHRV